MKEMPPTSLLYDAFTFCVEYTTACRHNKVRSRYVETQEVCHCSDKALGSTSIPKHGCKRSTAGHGDAEEGGRESSRTGQPRTVEYMNTKAPGYVRRGPAL